jgi:acetaldehyde dehydrogenase (acetylating)
MIRVMMFRDTSETLGGGCAKKEMEKIRVWMEVEGLGDYLSKYAGQSRHHDRGSDAYGRDVCRGKK